MAEKLGLEEARAAVEAVFKAASAKNLRYGAAVVDSGGELVYLARMDGAGPITARMSSNKAYTSAKWRADTKMLKDRLFDMGLGNERREMLWFGDLRFTPVWGGVVLRSKDGTVLGAIGTSGGSYVDDEELGQAGAKAFSEL